jgi:abortive infection bacteriophage resistance protein
MEEKINNQIEYLKEKGFIISDIEKIKWYLIKVWLHRLRRYFNTVDVYQWTDFQKIINSYIFDKDFRNINLWLLEKIENSFKNQFILNFENYLNPELYKIKYRDSRLAFLYNKISILKRNIRIN